jgi:hypothetical protein
MRRLYFLFPDVQVVDKVVDELLLAHIEWKHIHVVAKRGTFLGNLPEASVWQKTDIIPVMLRAMAIGGGAGILFALVMLAVEPQFQEAGGLVLVASLLAGVGVGAYLGGMLGLNVVNRRLKAFQKAMERGELLVIADVPRDLVEEVTERIKKAYPEAEPEGTELRGAALP